MRNLQAINTSQQAGRVQAAVLLAGSILPVMAFLLIAPILPQIEAFYHGVPGIAVLSPIALTIPAAMTALFSVPAGLLADKLGRKPVLFVALLIYGLAGMAPMWLSSIQEIIVSRVILGVSEAAVITVCTALIADYYNLAQRTKYLGLQTALSSVASIVFLAGGGLLGQFGWRTNFSVYFVAILLVPLVSFFIFEPKKRVASDFIMTSINPKSLNKLLMSGICAVTFATAIAFFVPPVQVGFVLTAMGIPSSVIIGITTSIGVASVATGSLLFRHLVRFNLYVRLIGGYLLSSSGFILISLTRSYDFLVVGLIIEGVGCGVLLPSLLAWAVAIIPVEVRARWTGLWYGVFFLGQFISPLVIFWLTKLVGTLHSAIGVIGLECLFLSGIFIVLPKPKQAPDNLSVTI